MSTVILFSTVIKAQTLRFLTNIDWLSAGQYCPGFTTPESFTANPAVYPSVEGFSCSVYSEKKFMIEGLNLLSFSGMFARSRSAMGLQVQYFGNPDYNELQAKINYGKSLGKINIGAGVSYNSMTVAGFEKESAINMQLATVWQLSENLYSALQIINPRISRKRKMSTASIYKLGFGYRHSSRVYTGFEFFKEEDKPPQALAVVYYRFARQFFARGGFISGTSQLFGGAGWNWKDFRVEVVSCQHAVLGASPALLFTYQKDNEE